jgi:hypothetical protein
MSYYVLYTSCCHAYELLNFSLKYYYFAGDLRQLLHIIFIHNITFYCAPSVDVPMVSLYYAGSYTYIKNYTNMYLFLKLFILYVKQNRPDFGRAVC